MDDLNAESENIDWKDVILKLQAFTRYLVKGKGWFRGGDTTTFIKGKEIDDYVNEAIRLYLVSPEKYKPSKGSLIGYLKKNLIRSLVVNDLVSSENKTSLDVFAIAEKTDEDNDSGSYLDSTLPYLDAYYDQEIDYEEIMAEIEAEISKDKIAEEIYLGERTYGMKRAEIIEEFNMSEHDFDNGKRRMQTILNNIAKKYDLKRQAI